MANPVEGVDYLQFKVVGTSTIFISIATETSPGLLSAADKVIIDNLVVVGLAQHGSKVFAGESFIQITFSTPIPAAKAANATLMATVRWPDGQDPSTVPGIITVNVIAVEDVGNNLVGMYLVPSVSGVGAPGFICGWSVQA